MKKILRITLSIFFFAPSISVVACGVGNNFGTDLSKIANWNWTNEEPYFNGYLDKWNVPISKTENKIEDLGKIDIESRGSYLDLNNFNTSFKTKMEIQKQVATGVSLNNKFLPNGNFVSNFKKINKIELYDVKNKIVDWKYEDDLDAKYNTSRIPLQNKEKVAQKWIDRQSSKALEANMTTIIESTSKENTIIDKKRTYERSFNNYQYNDILISWAGAIDEGIIVPPAKNQVKKLI
ncbi:hypothetical protein [Spiroplasma taiwanense]|uniref:hypothetical protein n=1 Tax=Spiroplasma taiwanense TaxID=2145 RepID=UPI00041D3BC9|nr:hypothetical protein [Spiroplasma taiwanense]